MKEGCPFKRDCDIYKGKYSSSRIIALDFRQECDNLPREKYKSKVCPFYDIYSGLITTMQKELEEVGVKLKSNIDKLDELFGI